MTQKEFDSLYKLPPEQKVYITQARIDEFMYHVHRPFLSYSGGKDSTVLAHIIRSMGYTKEEIPFVFFDTHNEDPSVYEMVKEYDAEVIPSPYTPKEVVEKVGYPLFNKEQAHVIDAIQRKVPYAMNGGTKSKKNQEYIELANTKYRLFTYSPLRISDKCCEITKKKPSREYAKKTGRYPILATMAVESFLRMQKYRKTGCNSFEGKIQSTPIGFWGKQDILWYIAQHKLKIASVYGAKITTHKLLGNRTCTLCGKDRTGCLYCGFGKGMEFAKRILKAKCPDYVKEHQEEFDNLH